MPYRYLCFLFLFWNCTCALGAIKGGTPIAGECTAGWREAGWELVPFPDTNAQYLSYQFRIPKGRKLSLHITGKRPVARYFSFVVYDQKTENSTSWTLDEAIPSAGPSGDVSLWAYSSGVSQAHVSRGGRLRRRIAAAFAPAPQTSIRKESSALPMRNTAYRGAGSLRLKSATLANNSRALVLPFDSENDQVVDIWFRSYLDNQSLVPPQIFAYEGDTLQPAECPPLDQKDFSIATDGYSGGLRRPSKYLEAKVPLPPDDGAAHMFAPNSASLGDNPHIRYLSLRIPVVPGDGLFKRIQLRKRGLLQKIGDVSILKFRVPSVPGQIENPDVRYWSLCLSGSDTSTSACIADNNVHLSKDGQGNTVAVVVIGPPTQDLADKIDALGFNYLDRSKHLVPIVFYRQMLARPDFEGRIAKIEPLPIDVVKNQQDPSVYFADRYIGEYAPTGKHCWSQEFLDNLCGMPELADLKPSSHW